MSSDSNSESKFQEKESGNVDLKEELAELKEEISPSTEEKEGDLSVEVMELKRRIDMMEKEVKSVSQSLKSTLMDIRSVIADIDNPFNLLRSMGVDKLVQKAMEHVEEEIDKAKREEMKKKLAKKGLEEPKEKIIALQSQPSVPATQITTQASKATLPAIDREALTEKLERKQPVKPKAANLVIGIEGSKLKPPTTQEGRGEKKEYSKTRLFLEEDYYEVYVTLVAGLLFLKLGEKGAVELVSEYAMRGGIPPKVASDLIDHLRMMKLYVSNFKEKAKLICFDLDIEDYMLMITLLKKMRQGGLKLDESTHILLLISLLRALSHIIASMRENSS